MLLFTPNKALADILPSPKYLQECQKYGDDSSQCRQAQQEIYNEYQFERSTGINFDSFSYFIVLFMINIVVELIIAVSYLLIRHKKSFGYLKPLVAVALANLISYPIFFLSYKYLVLDTSKYLIYVVFIEIAVVFFEALIIYLINKKKMDFAQSLWLSLVTNIATILLGFGFIGLTNIFS